MSIEVPGLDNVLARYKTNGAGYHIEPPALLPVKTFREFAAEYVPIAYVVEPILRSSFLYTLTGPTGSGKTAFMTVLAIAIASGRGDLIAMTVERRRILYCCFENPDDARMRFIVAASHLGISFDDLDIDIIDVRGKPESIVATIAALDRQYGLVMVDTLQAAFDGDNINDNVQTGEFMRRLRPIGQCTGHPATLVAAHPVKNASENNLIPYGGGAILNEIDGNLTLWKYKANGIVTLHHHGKFRGLEFAPRLFRFDLGSCPEMKDAKGRIIELPVIRPTNEEEAERREQVAFDKEFKALCVVADRPDGSLATWASDLGLKAKSGVDKLLRKLEKQKLVEQQAGHWRVTARGRKVIAERRPAPVEAADE